MVKFCPKILPERGQDRRQNLQIHVFYGQMEAFQCCPLGQFLESNPEAERWACDKVTESRRENHEVYVLSRPMGPL